MTRLAWIFTLCGLMNAGCNPQPRCGGDLYFDPDNVSCRPCPKDARFEHGTCICAGDKLFVANHCMLPEGAMPEPAPDTGVAADNCTQLCDFLKVCLADNAVAASALPEVITALNADDGAACSSKCESARRQTDSPLATCIQAGREQAQCEGDGTETGVRSALALIGQCSRAHAEDPLHGLLCTGLKQSALVANQIDFCD